jgi:hypothetical protein
MNLEIAESWIIGRRKLKLYCGRRCFLRVKPGSDWFMLAEYQGATGQCGCEIMPDNRQTIREAYCRN